MPQDAEALLPASHLLRTITRWWHS